MLKKHVNGFLFSFFSILLFTAVLQIGYAESYDDLLSKSFKWRNIGPANMGGRISDIDVWETDYRHVVVASASGGVWKTTNAGTTWDPIFDHYGSASIGAVALFQKKPEIIWVGTGEANVRNSVGWGDGVYKSTDGGKTFSHMGLKDSHHIAKIVTHPSDPEVVYVAAQGHLWAHSGEKGLFKTIDGGQTWEKLHLGLPDDGKTGCTHIIINPIDSNILYSAFWERIRRPYRFDSGGPNGGIFKSIDGGKSWKKLFQGLPEGDIGRIGLAAFRGDPDIIMAIIEHGYQPERETPEYKDMSKLGTGIYRSEDGGDNWEYMNRYNNRPFYYSQIYINPNNDKLVYTMGGRAQVSADGGKTFKEGMPGIAGDFHVMWLDPSNQDRYYVGNDKGISLTHDHGEHFNFFDNFCISQIYAVSADIRDPYFVYVGLQDNGIWGGPSNSRDFNGIFNDHWFKFHSGDGFYTASDPEDWTTVYTESQGGRIRRNHALFRQQSTSITPNPDNTGNWKKVIPEEDDPDHPVLRTNWNTPFLISHFNPHTLYYGANFLFKSIDKGNHWKVISPDLSTNDPIKTNRESGGITRDVTRAETHCTIVTLSESPLIPGLIWAGTDDGNIQLTHDDGATWKNVRENLDGVPNGIWVSRVEASFYKKETCYVTFDGHRSDDFRPFVFKTTDFGESWTDITGNLPKGNSTYVIREDRRNKDLLFVGTEFAVFYSVNVGKNWSRLMNGMPVVAIHDLIIHPRDNDLIAGTHGRGVWILDDITPLQQMNEEVLESEFFLFESPQVTLWEGISRGATRGHQLFIGKNPLSMSQVPPSNSPTQVKNSASINYYLKQKLTEPLMIEISTLSPKYKRVVTLKNEPGFQRYYWDLGFEPAEDEKQTFIAKMEEIFSSLKEKIDKEQKKKLQQLYKRFKETKDVDNLNHVRQELMREFRMNAPSRDIFGEELKRPLAGPGTYRLRLIYGENIQTGTLSIRKDPLYNSIQ